MQTYLVGGAVRDKIMGTEPKDKDYVIVGASPTDIKKLKDTGYESVGSSFPVFLHPETREEYALARTERKIAPGHTGFEVQTDNVTLEQDLYRRDLTINAIAYNERTKKYIDPYGGISDIGNKVLKHVSSAFAEDPLRVLRVARFAARLDFKIHESTLELMKSISKTNAILELPIERIHLEIEKMLVSTDKPSIFIKVLNDCNAWNLIFPEIKITKELLSLLDKAHKISASETLEEFFWCMLCNKMDINSFKVFSKRIKMKTDIIKSVSTLLTSKPFISLKSKSEDIVKYFDLQNFKNKGGCYSLYNLMDILTLLSKHEPRYSESILKMYDLYSSIDVNEQIEKYTLAENKKPDTTWIIEEVKKLKLQAIQGFLN